MITDFRNKLNFEPKQVKFIEKVYNLKTDHKTGLLLQELFKDKADSETDTKMLKLVLGEKQYKELMQELEETGAEQQDNDASTTELRREYKGTITFDAVDANGTKSGVTATFS